VTQCVVLLYMSVARITYTVLVETLNPAQSINQSIMLYMLITAARFCFYLSSTATCFWNFYSWRLSWIIVEQVVELASSTNNKHTVIYFWVIFLEN